MKINYSVNVASVLLVGGLVAGYLLYKNKFNPASTDNVIYGAVNSTGAAITGNDYFSLGSWFWDITHDETVL